MGDIHSYHYYMETALPIQRAGDSSGWLHEAVREVLYTQQQNVEMNFQENAYQ